MYKKKTLFRVTDKNDCVVEMNLYEDEKGLYCGQVNFVITRVTGLSNSRMYSDADVACEKALEDFREKIAEYYPILHKWDRQIVDRFLNNYMKNNLPLQLILGLYV